MEQAPVHDKGSHDVTPPLPLTVPCVRYRCIECSKLDKDVKKELKKKRQQEADAKEKEDREAKRRSHRGQNCMLPTSPLLHSTVWLCALLASILT